jgi:hypothetical protein
MNATSWFKTLNDDDKKAARDLSAEMKPHGMSLMDVLSGVMTEEEKAAPGA